jgi:hypothetical protein
LLPVEFSRKATRKAATGKVRRGVVVWRFFIAFYKEVEQLPRLIQSLLDSDMPTVTNGSFEIYVINNYGVYNERNDTKTLPVGVVVLDNVMRPDWAKGYLARDWNAALIHGFQDLSKPRSTFVTHFQADNQVNPLQCRYTVVTMMLHCSNVTL